ncbi:CE5 acetyl xylan esterase [Trichoderma cornu-damae]|uniref:CE5 acetyl xylan esterase n=1 Tax=Trichoderma cornu-damae TaxID=654480 RepID=A0A9P8TUA2_9HYPO|nr:CE5 acetyl xylan esterase [Trichoderma cornu-damae]
MKGIEPNPIRTDNLQEIPSWNLTRYRCAMGPVEEFRKTESSISLILASRPSSFNKEKPQTFDTYCEALVIDKMCLLPRVDESRSDTNDLLEKRLAAAPAHSILKSGFGWSRLDLADLGFSITVFMIYSTRAILYNYIFPPSPDKMPSIRGTITFLLGQALLATASPVEVEKRQCPGIHVFGARETTVGPGYGSSATVVNLIINSHPGTTAEPINYPACGGQASCGGISYANSVVAGINAVVTAVNNYHNACPNTMLVLVGYSQVVISRGDPSQGYPNTAVPLSAGAVSAIRAAIFMGDPRYVYGLAYNVGTCAAQGFDPRPVGFVCPNGSKIKSYCDAADPYCCNGNNANVHQGYGQEYGQQALAFVNSKLV